MEKTKEVCVLKHKMRMDRRTKQFMFFFLVFALVFSSSSFAAGNGNFSITALDSLGDVLKGALGSVWLKAILACALVIEFGVAAWGQSKGASELVSGAVKWMFATGGMLGATGIANFIFDEVEVEDLSQLIKNMTVFIV